MKIHTYIFLFISLFVVNNSQTKMVEFVEDAYVLQAPAEIVKVVQDIAEEQHFDTDYEVVVPKKAGMQINPWNKYIAFGKNPKTENVLVVINPEWLSQLTHDELKYLITRIFWSASKGSSIPLKMVPWIFALISILSIILLTIGLGKYHKTAHLKRWWRIVIALMIMWVINTVIMSKIHLKIVEYLTAQIDRSNHELAFKKSGLTKEVAITALTKLDTVVKENFKNGDTFWKPFEKVYEKQIDALKSQSGC